MGSALSILSGAPGGSGRGSTKSGRLSKPKPPPKIPKPSAEHAAYVKRLLGTVPGPSSTVLPLRWAQPNKNGRSSGEGVSDGVEGLKLQAAELDQTTTDLYEALVNVSSLRSLVW